MGYFVDYIVEVRKFLARVVRFAKALWTFVRERNNYADVPDVGLRLSHCLTCHYRKENVCSKCGCLIVVKATFKDERCPIGLWDETNIFYM